MKTVSPVALTPEEQARVDVVRREATLGASGIPRLLTMLADPSWTVRREVVAALGAIGQPAVRPLCELLRTARDNEARIAAAVDALVGSSGHVLEEITLLAADPDPAVVADAAQILGRRRNKEAVPLLVQLVAHTDDNVSVAAIEGLGRIGGAGGVETLVNAVRSGNFFRVFPAIDVLGRSGDPRAIAPLAELVSNPTYALEAVRALGRTGEKAAVAPIATLLGHPSVSTVRVAAVALHELYGRYAQQYGNPDGVEEALRSTNIASVAVRRLNQALGDADSGERVAIAFTLGVLGGEAAIASLTVMLDSTGPEAGSAAEALRRLGRDSDEQVREALREGNSARRKLLLPIVARVSAAPAIAPCLQDPDPAVRALACDALGRLGATSQVPAIFPLLADSNPRVVQAATGAIQSLGTSETKTLALAAARDANPAKRRAALRVLAYFGYSEALSIFIQALDDEDLRIRDAALAGLPYLSEPGALDALLAAARSPEHKTRSAAMRGLGQCSHEDPRIAAYLLKAVHDEDAWVRYYACQALGKLEVETATAAVAGLLSDEAGQVRVAAIEALSHFRNDTALQALAGAAQSEEADVRRAALIGLGLARRPEALPLLISATQSPDPATRLVAISALADASSPHVLPALAKAARDGDESVRAAALGFLAANPSQEATAVLVDLLREPLVDRERLLRMLAMANEGRVAGLLGALETADDEVAKELTSALARIRTPEATAALLSTLSGAAVPARKAAATALASFGTLEATAALRRASETDPDLGVRQICSVLLSQ